jgi:hypothetical protein
MTTLGVKGTGYGQLDAPNSLAIDQLATCTSPTL